MLRIATDFGLQIDLSRGISPDDLMKLLQGAMSKIRKEDLFIGEKELDEFLDMILSSPGDKILYFTDNHGELILDQILVEQLLAMGYQVAVVAKY